MLRLGDSQWWLAVDASGECWTLYRVVGGKRPRTLREGRFTSPRHALQVLEATTTARKVAKGAIAALRDLAAAMDAGETALGSFPGEPSESDGRNREGDGRTRPPEPTEDDDHDE